MTNRSERKLGRSHPKAILLPEGENAGPVWKKPARFAVNRVLAFKTNNVRAKTYYLEGWASVDGF